MPTYDYECEACGHAFELFQSMSAPVKRKCPQCGKNKLQRLIGKGAAVLFKGTGFYETDYRKDSYQQEAKADSESTGKAGSDTSTGSGDKSESKAEKPASKSESGGSKKQKRKKKGGAESGS